MTQPDLFSRPYPRSPGYKAQGTSRTAAKAAAPRAPTLRDRILDLLKTAPMTPDEAATAMGETVLAVRPRFSELHRLGLIVDTGQVRPNVSGLKASVWRAA